MIKPVVYTVTLDVYKIGSQKVLSMMRGDTKRSIVISLTENDRPYVLTEGMKAWFTALKPDGNYIYNECEIDTKNNTIIYNVTEQTTAVNGKVACQVRLVGANGGIISTPSFALIVDDLLYNEQPIVASSKEFNALTAFLAELNEKVNRGDFNGKSIYIRGSVYSPDELQDIITTSAPGDGYITGDDHLYVFDGDTFVDVGLVRGPQGLSGVYIGSGDMPDGYNVQIDPDGAVLVMDKTLNAESKNPVENQAIYAALEELRGQLQSMGSALAMMSNSLESMNSRLSAIAASDISTNQYGDNVEESLAGLWATKADAHNLQANMIQFTYGNTDITNVADALTLALGRGGI